MTSLKHIPSSCQVVIVGGGPSGLALATELKNLGIDDVVILERQAQAGGIPQHCGHYPFGFWEYKRLLKGPDYAHLLRKKARDAGVNILTNCHVTSLAPGGRLSLTTPDGSCEMLADRVVLATGVRESSRAQRLIGGQRPQGVLSTGALQSMIYQHGKRPFKRPVILGSELVSFSAILTCRHMDIKPIAMIEEKECIIARSFNALFPKLLGIPLILGARNLTIHGRDQVEALSYQDGEGKDHQIETDGVIISGHFRPESALLLNSHLEMDPATGGPRVDQYGRTNDEHFFSTGNLLRPVETSAWCWSEGHKMAHILADDLHSEQIPPPTIHSIELEHEALRFVMPQCLSLPPAKNHQRMEHLQVRLNRAVKGQLTLKSDDKILWSGAINSRPERRILIPLDPWIDQPISGSLSLTIEEKH